MDTAFTKCFIRQKSRCTAKRVYMECALKSFGNGQLLFDVDRNIAVAHIQMSPARYY